MSGLEPASTKVYSGITADSSNFPVTPVSSDAPTFFATLLSLSPQSPDAVVLLAGNVASYIQEQTNPQLAALYLQVVARHIVPLEQTTDNNNGNNNSSGNGTTNATQPVPSVFEARHRNEILQAVGCAAAKCNPRSSISLSGILPALVQLISSSSDDVLTAAHVELMQCSLLAGQYRYTQRRIISNNWPRPVPGVSTEQILRYYYYRGMAHMACDEWNLAIRCFWTCVTVPSDTVSAITIAAWKKMVLCHCLLEPTTATLHASSKTTSSSKNLTAAAAAQQLPSFLTLTAATSTQVVRFFAVASTFRNSNTTATEQPNNSNSNNTQYSMPTSATTTTTSTSANIAYGVRAYYDLIKSFCQGDGEQFKKVAHENASTLQADGNIGICKRLETDLLHRQVYHLSRIYSVVPLHQLSVQLQMPPDQVRVVLLQLSEKGMVIELDANDGMVSFPDKDVHGKNGRTDRSQQLESHTEQIIALAERIRQLDVAVATDPRYQHLMRRQASATRRATAGAPPRGVADL